jgi:hypothetical protein
LTDYTRPATWDDLKVVASHFADAGVRTSRRRWLTTFRSNCPISKAFEDQASPRPKTQMDAAVIAEALRRLKNS